MVLKKEATELDLMEQTLGVYLGKKSERRSSKKKRREMEGRVRSGGRGEGRKRRRLVDALVMIFVLRKLYDTSVLKLIVSYPQNVVISV
jgi:hypothetical protein